MNLPDNLRIALDLSEHELRVYLAALELGSATMQALSRKSGVNRSTIYTFMENLKDCGFIHETKKGKRRVYSGMDPEQLLELEQGRIKDLERVLPSIKAINNKPKNKPSVTFYEGLNGIKEVYSDMLKERDSIILAYEDVEALKSELPEEYYQYFPKERAGRGILIKSLSRDTKTARELSKKNIGLLRETKFLNVEKLGTDINIYGNKVALMNLKKKTEMAVIIEDENIANTFREIWKQLWERV